MSMKNPLTPAGIEPATFRQLLLITELLLLHNYIINAYCNYYFYNKGLL